MDATEALALLGLTKKDFHDFSHIGWDGDYLCVYTTESVFAGFSPNPVKCRYFVCAGKRVEGGKYRVYDFDPLSRRVQ